MTKHTDTPLDKTVLPITIVKINPGVDRQAEEQIKKLSKVAKKTDKSLDYRRKLFSTNFESRRHYRKNLYERLRPKLDPASRLAIDRFKAEDRKKEFEKLKKLEGQKLIQHASRSKTGSYKDDQSDHKSPSALDLSSDTGPDCSRRSSLKSSILEIGISRCESPGPSFTENPLGSLNR